MRQTLLWAQDVIGPTVIVRELPGGSYNDNVQVRTASGRDYIIRLRRRGVRELDLRVLPEFEIVSAVSSIPEAAAHVPIAVAKNEDLDAALYTYVGRVSLNDVSPKGTPLDRQCLESIATISGAVARVPEPTLAHWKTYQNSRFAILGIGPDENTYSIVRAVLIETYERMRAQDDDVLTALGLPSVEQLTSLTEAAVHERKPVLAHGDIHRRNLRAGAIPGQVQLIDWEMALVGDAVYDLAVALWKLKLTSRDQQTFLKLWESMLPPDRTDGWSEDVWTYSRLESLKTAIVHVYRSADALGAQPSSAKLIAQRWLADRNAVRELVGDASLDEELVVRQLARVKPHMSGNWNSPR